MVRDGFRRDVANKGEVGEGQVGEKGSISEADSRDKVGVVKGTCLP